MLENEVEFRVLDKCMVDIQGVLFIYDE